MSSSCSDPTICREGCCRSFLGTQFCDVESNCVAHPTWLIALVPAALGLAALVLLIIVIIRLKNRKVINSFDKVANIDYNRGNEMQSERNQQSDRPIR